MPFPDGTVPPHPENPVALISDHGFNFDGLYRQEDAGAFGMASSITNFDRNVHYGYLPLPTETVADHRCGPETFPFGAASCPTRADYEPADTVDLRTSRSNWNALATLDPHPDFFVLYVSVIMRLTAFTDGCNPDPTVKECGPGYEPSFAVPDWTFPGGHYLPAGNSYEGWREVHSGTLGSGGAFDWTFVNSGDIEFKGFMVPDAGGAYQGDAGMDDGNAYPSVTPGTVPAPAFLLWPWSAISNPLSWVMPTLISRGYSGGSPDGEIPGFSWWVQPFWLLPASAPFEVPPGVLPLP